MIVDSHIYCFRAPDAPAGHPTAADHMKLWQWGYALHHQPAYRTRDREPADSQLLLDPAPDDPLRLATNRNFRVDRVTNRLIWTVDGEDCTKQYLPPNVIEFRAGSAIAEMDYAGIDWALMHVDAALEKDVEYLASCVRAFPDRLRSMAPVDEWLIPTDPETAIRRATEAIEIHGLHAFKIIPEYAYRIAHCTSFDEPAWRPFWDAVTKLGVPIFFTLGASPGCTDPRQGFIDELWVLRRWMERYPEVLVSVTHGFPWRDFHDGDRFVLPEAMWGPFTDAPNLSIEVSFPIRIGDLLDYPWRETWPVAEAMVDRIGPGRLLWGTDMPFQNRFCTYRQSRDYLERYCTSFLAPADMALLMGGTAARILKLPVAEAASAG
ncbi:MAG TPA: amidohydrolase family protein [Candidatus Saccharimonadales bacterium]|nr:amidohydrolase family protein [Candidatus Saccharimonadales bacterium]